VKNRVNLKSQDGWVIVTAMLVMAILLAIGLALAKLADTQSKQSGSERVRETSFNLGEGVLSAQSVVLQNNWPVKAPCSPNAKGCGYPVECTYANGALTGGTAGTNCPTPSELIGVGKAFGGVDITTPGTRFVVQVRDNRGTASSSYDKTVVNDNNGCGTNVVCTWDANDDHRLWVRVDAWAQYQGSTAVLERIKKRSMVALLQLENVPIPFPQNAVTGGSATFDNSGNKILVESTGSQVVTRCSPFPGSSLQVQSLAPAPTIIVNNNNGFEDLSKKNQASDRQIVIGSGQTAEIGTIAPYPLGVNGNVITLVSPTTITHPAGSPVYDAPPNKDVNGNDCQNWSGGGGNQTAQVNPKTGFISDPSYPPAMSTAEVEALSRAADAKVYYDTCPSPTDVNAWTGHVIVMSTTNTILNCSIKTGTTTINSSSNPGYIIIQRGTLDFQSALTYYGLIYMQNLMNYGSNDPFVVSMSGNPTIYGGIAVDGFGKVQIGQASGNEPSVVFTPTPFRDFSATGAAGLIQNTWRELDPGQ
jgi:Tfp pilus assembly protein PilX